MEFDETQGELYREIINFLSPPDGEPTSGAAIEKNLQWERKKIADAVKDLIAFGELELINVSQYPRVRLRQQAISEAAQMGYAPPPEELDSVWHAYITEQSGTGRTRARRLYRTQEEAESHLKQIANVDSLTPVPSLEGVWCTNTTGAEAYKQEYAVLRREPIFSDAVDPYP